MEQFVYTNEGRVLLREAKTGDINKIYKMYQSSLPNLWWQSEKLNEFRFNLIKEANGKIFIALLNNEIIGHAEVVLPDSKEEPVYLVCLEIHDNYGRRKFGIELVRYSAIVMKNLGYQSYITWPDTNKSKGLYKKVGLKELENNPQIISKIIAKRDIDIKEIKDLHLNDRPSDLDIAVGCPWGRSYTWLKAFEAGKRELFDYKGPYAKQVKFEDVEGAVLLDGHSIYIYLPKEEVDNLDLIESLLVYSSNLALDNNINSLHINIKEELWSKIDLSDIWEAKEGGKRLEMEMEF